jgi:rhodanese-related sulfurtransferase
MSQLEDMSPKAVADALKSGDILLIDVREANEYGLERIPGALLYPLSTLDPKAIPVGGPKRVVFHCAAGRRSAMAAMRCQDEGVNVDAHLAGGLGAWKEAKLPLIETDPLTGQVKGG